MMDSGSDPPDFLLDERIRSLQRNMTADEIRAVLGQPACVQAGSSPSFEGPRQRLGIDEVWLYRHPRSEKVPTKQESAIYLGFRDGILFASWEGTDPATSPNQADKQAS